MSAPLLLLLCLRQRLLLLLLLLLLMAVLLDRAYLLSLLLQAGLVVTFHFVCQRL